MIDPVEYATYDGLGLAELIRRGELSVGEVAGAALMAQAIVGAELRAVVEVYKDAPERSDTDLRDGPFRGVPFLIKDIGPHFAGLKVEFGSRLCEGYVSRQDSAFGRLVKVSGVSLVGRTNTPEFSMALCADNLLYGATSNPWQRGYSTSGSSGGAAAAVAASIVPVAHGSDMGGSIRGPAAWCGAVGLQPSRGRVSAGPLRAESGSGMAQSFVLTGSVRDTAAMLDCLSQAQPGDPFVIARPERPYLDYLGAAGGPYRIAWSAAPLMDAPVDPEVAAAVEQTARTLEELGHDVCEDAPRVDLAAIDRACLEIWYFGFDEWLDDLASQVGRAVGSDTVERATLRFYEFARAQDPRRFLAALDELNTIRRTIGPFFSRYDVWLSPSCAQVAQPNGVYGMDVDLPPEEFLAHEERPCQFLVPYNVTGQPAISLPLAQHTNGLPIGVQLGARPAEEHLLIELAAELEQAMPWQERIPPLHVRRVAGRDVLPPRLH
jgi:amidase